MPLAIKGTVKLPISPCIINGENWTYGFRNGHVVVWPFGSDPSETLINLQEAAEHPQWFGLEASREDLMQAVFSALQWFASNQAERTAQEYPTSVL